MSLDPASQNGRYEVSSRRAVIDIFSTLVKSPIPITMTIAQIGETHTSFLIAFEPSFEELVFDASGIAQVAQLDGSGGLVATVQINAVWFRFDAPHVVAARGYDQPAFRARLPTTLLRTQRRNSMRYPVSLRNPPVCDVPTKDGAFRLRVIDISLSGVALAIEGSAANYPLGALFEKCLLHLPDMGAIECDLAVAYLHTDVKASDRRIGCRFSNMLASSLTHLQRYIAYLERERLTEAAVSDSSPPV